VGLLGEITQRWEEIEQYLRDHPQT
jgi:hypothetical protein